MGGDCVNLCMHFGVFPSVFAKRFGCGHQRLGRCRRKDQRSERGSAGEEGEGKPSPESADTGKFDSGGFRQGSKTPAPWRVRRIQVAPRDRRTPGGPRRASSGGWGHILAASRRTRQTPTGSRRCTPTPKMRAKIVDKWPMMAKMKVKIAKMTPKMA